MEYHSFSLKSSREAERNDFSLHSFSYSLFHDLISQSNPILFLNLSSYIWRETTQLFNKTRTIPSIHFVCQGECSYTQVQSTLTLVKTLVLFHICVQRKLLLEVLLSTTLYATQKTHTVRSSGPPV